MNAVRMMSKTLLVAASLVGAAVVTSPGTAAAQKKGKAVKACGITAIPLSVGNKWVYTPVQHPTPLDPAQTKMLPVQASKVTITVTAVEPNPNDKKAATVKLTEVVEIPVSVEENGKFIPKVETKTLETQITCTATTMTISPESFWFNGEPGGLWNTTLDGVERTGHTFPFVGGKFQGAEWHDDVKASWTRVATPGSEADLGTGTLTLSRRVVFTGDEQVATALGQWKAAKVGTETHGEIAVANATGKPYLLPDGIYSFFWIVDGVGIAQVHNSFVHAYSLTEMTVAK